MADRAPFDPARHTTKVGGNDYLEVKFGIVWFRDLNPNGKIETELVHFASPLPHPETGEVFAFAVFKATITSEGGAIATGYAHETIGDFREYLEKAETKAIGRALRALGFGAQSTTDDDASSESDEWAKFRRWLKDDAKLSPQDFSRIVGKPANQFATPQAAYHALAAKDAKYAKSAGAAAGGK